VQQTRLNTGAYPGGRGYSPRSSSERNFYGKDWLYWDVEPAFSLPEVFCGPQICPKYGGRRLKKVVTTFLREKCTLAASVLPQCNILATRHDLICIQRVYTVHVGLFVIVSRKSRSSGFHRFSYRRPLEDQLSVRWPRKNVSYDIATRSGSDSGSGKKVLMTFTTPGECCSSQSNATLCPGTQYITALYCHQVASSPRQMLAENHVSYFAFRLVRCWVWERKRNRNERKVYRFNVQSMSRLNQLSLSITRIKQKDDKRKPHKNDEQLSLEMVIKSVWEIIGVLISCNIINKIYSLSLMLLIMGARRQVQGGARAPPWILT